MTVLNLDEGDTDNILETSLHSSHGCVVLDQIQLVMGWKLATGHQFYQCNALHWCL